MSVGTAWLLLLLSGVVDVVWAYSVKRADGFQNLWWAGASLVLLAIFITLLTKALQVLPLGPAYAVWTGIGAAGTFAVGALLLGEPATLLRLLLVGMIVLGVIGLRMTTA